MRIRPPRGGETRRAVVRNGPGMRGSGGPGKDKAEKLARRPGYPGRGGANLIWELRGDKLRAGRLPGGGGRVPSSA